MFRDTILSKSCSLLCDDTWVRVSIGLELARRTEIRARNSVSTNPTVIQRREVAQSGRHPACPDTAILQSHNAVSGPNLAWWESRSLTAQSVDIEAHAAQLLEVGRPKGGW